MSNKQLIINAIKEMDIKKLELLLDNNRSYMDVPKALFLEKLKQQFDYSKQIEVFSFDKVLLGICNSCNKGCDAYTFLTKDNNALDLFFEEKDGQVSDIYLCKNLKNEKNILPKYKMYFDFYEDEKVTFKPSIDFLIKKQKIELAITELKLFKDKFVSIIELSHWKKKHQELLTVFYFNIFNKRYKEFLPFEDLTYDIKNVVALLEKHKLSKQAMLEFNLIENEKELVYWLFAYESKHLSNYGFKRLEGWEKSSLIAFENTTSMVIDCSICHESLEFSYLYNKHTTDLLEKYKPTKEHFNQSNGGVLYSLENHLRIHGMYLDILPEVVNKK